MTSCTYRFKNASGEEVTITGQAEMKAFLADGGLEQLLPGKVLPWRGAASARKAQIDKEYAHLPEGNRPPAFQYGEGLEPWQIDSAEFSKQRNGNPHFDQSGFRTDGDYLRASNNAHKKLVAQAVAEGKPVPASVLAEYPDLKQSKVDPAAPAGSPKADEKPAPQSAQWDALPEKERYRLVQGRSNQDAARRIGYRKWADLSADDKASATSAIEDKALLVRALTSGVVSAEEYPSEEVAKSFSHISHSPEIGAYVARNEFLEAVQREYDEAAPLAQTEDQKAKLRAAIEDFKEGYLRNDRAVMKARASAYSSKVAGGSKLDSKQVSTRNGALDRAAGSLSDWLSGARGAVMDAVLAARNADQLDAERQAKDNKAAQMREQEESLVSKLIAFKPGDDVKFGGYQIVRITKGRDGYPSSVTVDAADLTDNKFDLARTLFKGDKDKLRAVVDAVRAKQSSADQSGKPSASTGLGAPAVLRTDTLPDTITVDGVERPTTNSKGQPIHPAEEGVRNFWRWFGESRVVDEQGRPLVVYHGTRRSFDSFVPSKPRGAFGNPVGIYFDTDRQAAEEYAMDVDGATDEKSRIIEAYVRIANDGDGVIKTRTERGLKQLEIIAFRPDQIKSATGNTGAFSDSPDIRLRTDAETDESAVSRDAAESFVRQFVEEYPSAPEIILAENFSQLPDDVQRDAIAQGSGPFKAKGAMKNGKIYVLRRNHYSMADMEATVFHEVLGHAGTRKLLGPKFSQELNKLFIGLGGYSGLEKIMAARGMSAQFHGYMDGVRQAKERNPDLWTDALAATVMTEEVFAHIAEQKGGKALRDRFMALVGMVRDWLRNHGFAELASLGESDILFMLQRARSGMREPSGIVRNGVRIAGGEVLAENGQVISVEGDRDFDALKVLAGRLGLTVDDGPTVFSNSLPESQKSGDYARMDDANNVAGKQAPTPAGDVEAGGAEPRYTSRNWRDWYELPRFQSDDDSTVLFNHGHGGYIQRVEDRKSGVFDGIFALRDPGMTERGPDVTAFRIPNDKMLSQRDLEYDLDYDTVSAALADVFPKNLELGSADFDEVWKVIVEDNNQHEAIGVEEDGSIRDGSYMDIMGYSADDFADASWEAQNLRGRLAQKLGYQAIEMDDENGTSWYIVPGVESIPLNEPTPSDTPDGAPALLRTINTASGRKRVRDHVAEAYSNVTGESAKTFNWWQRTVGSQYGKAKSDKDFGRVYDAAHAFLDGVSAFAKEASERASGILPHLDTWRDVAAGANVRKQWADSQDYQAIAPAIFDGTLANGTTGRVWTDDQLRDKYNLNDKQIGHYREFRAAVDFSLETLAASEMARLARASKMDAADRDMGMDDALSFYLKQLDPRIKAARDAVEGKGGEIVARHTEERAALEEAAAYLTEGAADLLRNEMQSRHDKEIDEVMGAERSLENLRASFTEKVEQIRKLQSEGYAPLMRFGQYTVDVVKLDDEGQPMQDEDGNPDRPFFGMFESEAEARKAEKILAEEYPGYTVTRGVLSTEANQLYRGLTPETAEMFARLLGTDENEAFQAYLKQAVANRSAMKRLINRMGVEGFATDVPRVLSAFITSNARLSSGNWYFGEMSKAVEAIPKHKGDVKTEAVRLMQYVQNPVEEAAGLRGFLFFSFLGGSIASALVNLTQTFTTTLPYLSQFGAGDVAKALPKAMALSGKMMKKGLDAVSDKDLKDALRKASDEGVVDPQEIHLLMAEAGGNGASVGFSGLAGAMNKEWATPAARVTRSLSQAWGMLFGAAEKYNRHVAFIAAWEVAPKGVDRYEFAKNAVTETQFDYTKASRPNWARGAVGATLFTFKTFSINYVEFMSRLPSRERAIALGVLFLLAGMSGMPGGDDLDDVVDTVAQKMGYNWNNAAARHAWLVRVIGVGGADFVERGISSMLPLDVSARLGMGNLIPGTAVLQKSNASPSRDVQEFFGPAGSVVAGFREVFDNAGGGKGLIETASPIAPKMLKDLRQAVDMVQTGQYRDTKGRKVVDVDGVDALLKGIGFQPNAVAEPRRIERMLAQSSGMQRIIRQDISELWARGVAEQDAQKIESARSILREWNEKNPDSRIVMNPTSIAQRVRAMRLTSAERLVKATPKDMRNALAAEMAIQQ